MISEISVYGHGPFCFRPVAKQYITTGAWSRRGLFSWQKAKKGRGQGPNISFKSKSPHGLSSSGKILPTNGSAPSNGAMAKNQSFHT